MGLLQDEGELMRTSFRIHQEETPDLMWKMIDDFQRSTEDSLSLCDCSDEKFAASLASLKESCSDFLLDILKNPLGSDSRLDMEDISYFQRCRDYYLVVDPLC